MNGWSSGDAEEIVVGRRRMRTGRRRQQVRGLRWFVTGVVVAVVTGLALGSYYLFLRPQGLDALPPQAVVAAGGFRASIGDNNTLTVGLEIRNIADIPLTVIAARLVAPAGLTSIALTVVPAGENYQGFALDGDLPTATAVDLGTDPSQRNAIVVARFTVDCAGLLAVDDAVGERIFVTIQVGDQQREEELTPPVVGDIPWLTASGRRICLDPISTAKPSPPLSPLP